MKGFLFFKILVGIVSVGLAGRTTLCPKEWEVCGEREDCYNPKRSACLPDQKAVNAIVCELGYSICGDAESYNNVYPPQCFHPETQVCLGDNKMKQIVCDNDEKLCDPNEPKCYNSESHQCLQTEGTSTSSPQFKICGVGEMLCGTECYSKGKRCFYTRRK